MKTFNDTDLREALRRKYADVPQMPTDLSERIMKSLTPRPLQREREQKRASQTWRKTAVWGFLAAAAASIALLLVLHFGNNPSEEQPMVVQKTNLGMKEAPVNSGMKDEAPLNPPSRGKVEAPLNKPKKVKRKAVRKSNFAMPAPTDADQMLAETEPAPEEERPAAHLSPEQEVLLAMEAREQDFRSRGKRLQREIEEMMRN